MPNKFSVLVLTASLLTIGFSANASDVVDADNSAQNKKQVQNAELDARDQGSSKSDTELTRRIRQEVVKQDQFSTNAKNVKIITRSGQVTLKGPVKTMEEKKQIEMLAKKVAGVGHVSNEIEIEMDKR